MKETINLAEKMADIIEKNTSIMTVDDFYDKHNIPQKARTDFATQIIIEKAKEIVQNRKGIKTNQKPKCLQQIDKLGRKIYNSIPFKYMKRIIGN